MSISHTLEKHESHLYISLHGAYNYEDFKLIPDLILNACDEHNIFKVLINGLSVQKTDIPQMERYYLGEILGEKLGAKFKVAVIWPEKHINKFTETVAQNRMTPILVCSSITEGLDWLLE